MVWSTGFPRPNQLTGGRRGRTFDRLYLMKILFDLLFCATTSVRGTNICSGRDPFHKLSGVTGSLSTGPEVRLVIAGLLVTMEQEGGGSRPNTNRTWLLWPGVKVEGSSPLLRIMAALLRSPDP